LRGLAKCRQDPNSLEERSLVRPRNQAFWLLHSYREVASGFYKIRSFRQEYQMIDDAPSRICFEFTCAA
jgi:hypothetical protein